MWTLRALSALHCVKEDFALKCCCLKNHVADLLLSPLLSQMAAGGTEFAFAINRSQRACRTPRRNPDVEMVLAFCRDVAKWADAVSRFFVDDLFAAQDHSLDFAQLDSGSVFNPVLPLLNPAPFFGAASKEAVADGGSVLLSAEDVHAFLAEQQRTLAEKVMMLSASFPEASVKVITVVEAVVVATVRHLQDVVTGYFQGVAYLEEMLRKQLVAAVGKAVQPLDFTSYSLYHNRKLFLPAYQPRPFSYAVRQPDHYPEGVLAIEAEPADRSSTSQPIHTMVCRSDGHSSLTFALSASANVTVRGEVLVHGYLQHCFSGTSGGKLVLSARARQFSCFLVLLGRMCGAGVFDPQSGMLVQNRDDFTIPLELETIPSAKAFKVATTASSSRLGVSVSEPLTVAVSLWPNQEAVSSLSPQQQRFAHAFRSMQLTSTLFDVCVIQIKPQLERVLKLPDDSLTKVETGYSPLGNLALLVAVLCVPCLFCSGGSCGWVCDLLWWHTVRVCRLCFGWVAVLWCQVEDENRLYIHRRVGSANLVFLTALSKEIKLTQELMELFVKYSIPSDQLSFGGPSRCVSVSVCACVCVCVCVCVHVAGGCVVIVANPSSPLSPSKCLYVGEDQSSQDTCQRDAGHDPWPQVDSYFLLPLL